MNKFFAEIVSKRAKEIEAPITKFVDYLEQCDTIQTDNPVFINELEDAILSLQINKSSGYDSITSNVVNHCFGSLYKPLIHIFNLSIQKWVFTVNLKIARVAPIYHNNYKTDFENYRPTSVLSYSLKIWERTVYNRLHSNNIIYKKQFGFQNGHFTEHSIFQLVDQTSNSSRKSSSQ